MREVVEIESGKRNDRPALAEALRLCRHQRATLVTAQLDRLARNVVFFATLMEKLSVVRAAQSIRKSKRDPMTLIVENPAIEALVE